MITSAFPNHSQQAPVRRKYIADQSAVEATPGTVLARLTLDDFHIVLGCFCKQLLEEHGGDAFLWFLIKVVVAGGKMDARLNGHVEGGYAVGRLLGS